MMDCLWFGADVVTSVEKKRIHDQLMPNVTVFEQGFDKVGKSVEMYRYYKPRYVHNNQKNKVWYKCNIHPACTLDL